MAIIEKLIVLPGINVEVIGSWIWIDGNTFPVSAAIKASVEGCEGYVCTWNRNRKVWQIHESGYRRFTKKEFSRDELAMYFGSEQYDQKLNKEIA